MGAQRPSVVAQTEACGGTRRVLVVTPLGHPQAQTAEGVGNRVAADHWVNSAAAEPEFAGDTPRILKAYWLPQQRDC